MTTTQLSALNAEILQNLGVIAKDESVLNRVAKYLRKVMKEMTTDSTEMTREEFFHRIDKGRAQILRGEGIRMLPNENLEDFLKRVK
mgnify:CR=1 FL=1